MKFILKKASRFRVLTAGILLLAGVFGNEAMAQTWTGYTYATVPSDSAVKGLKRIDKQIAHATDGKVDIKMHLGGTLHIKVSNITQAVGAGVVQFATDGFFLGNVPIGGILRLPFLINNDTQWNAASEVMKPYMKQGFARQGVIYLGGYRYPMNTIFTTFPIKSLADLSGHKIRVSSPQQAYFVKQFGATPVQLSGAEVPTALERNVIEGVITASAGGAKKWHDMLKYNYRLGVSYFNSAIIANKVRFDQLSPKTQATIRRIVQSQGKKITKDFESDESVQMNAQKSDGMVIVNASDADVAKARSVMESYWKKWAKHHGSKFSTALNKVEHAIKSAQSGT